MPRYAQLPGDADFQVRYDKDNPIANALSMPSFRPPRACPKRRNPKGESLNVQALTVPTHGAHHPSSTRHIPSFPFLSEESEAVPVPTGRANFLIGGEHAYNSRYDCHPLQLAPQLPYPRAARKTRHGTRARMR